MKLFNKVKQSVKNQYNKLTHSSKTGEKLTPIKNAIDDLTQINTTRKLSNKELTKLRALTVASTGAKIATGVVTGLAIGKTAFTGTLIGIGAYVVTDIVTYAPMQSLTNKVLTVKTKK